MNEAPSFKPSIILAALAGFFSGAIVYYFTQNSIFAFVSAALFAIFIFFISSFLIKFYLVKKLEKINEHILESLKTTRFKAEIGNNELSILESSVKRLINEQTTEIGHLKELERLRKEFLGDVAHELRSPIFNIQGYIHTLIEGALEDEEVSRKFLDKAAKHVDHLSSLVEDLVTISRIEAGDIKLEIADFDIKELIHEVLELQDLPAKHKNILLQTKFNNTPVLVRADRPKIKQVLNNLIGNSIKYGRENGHSVISIEDEPGTITIKVADNGEGIADEHLPRVFERFYRVDKSRSRTVPSTGLGLAIVKHFIEAHKQKILVTSREGVGSIFSFTLQKA